MVLWWRSGNEDRIGLSLGYDGPDIDLNREYRRTWISISEETK